MIVSTCWVEVCGRNRSTPGRLYDVKWLTPQGIFSQRMALRDGRTPAGSTCSAEYWLLAGQIVPTLTEPLRLRMRSSGGDVGGDACRDCAIQQGLAKNPLFEGAPLAAIHELARAAVITEHAKGRTIFQRGDLSDGVYWVLRGRIRTVGYSEGGGEVTLNMINPGDIFGEVAAIGGGDADQRCLCCREVQSGLHHAPLTGQVQWKPILRSPSAWPQWSVEDCVEPSEMVDSIVFSLSNDGLPDF